MANPSAWSDLIASFGLMNLSLQVGVGTRVISEWNLTLARLAQRRTRSMTAIAGGRVITLRVPRYRGSSSSLDRFFGVLAPATDLRDPRAGLGL